MKPYFIKYIPVPGEIKAGDMAFVVLCSGAKSTLIMSDGGKTTNEDRKAILFLCSRNIKAGDKVFDGDLNEGIVIDCDCPHNIEIDYKNGGQGVLCIVKDCEYKFGGGHQDVFKIIGPIGKTALKWVKEGDEFEEDQCWAMEGGFSSIRRPINKIREECVWDGESTEYPRIYLPCPCCGVI